MSRRESGRRMSIEKAVDWNQIERVERQVMAIYQRENPSFNPKIRSSLSEHVKTFAEMLQTRLGFPISDFKQESVLDAGCGTGENTIVYSLLGAGRVVGIDANPQAIELAQELFAEHACRGELVCESIFSDKLVPQSFDFVSSIGVLHHTANPEYAFSILSSYLKPGGHFLLNICDLYGFWLRRARRALISLLAGTNPRHRYLLGKYLFFHFNHRASKYGGRSKEAVVYDLWVNPQQSCHGPREINRWFNENGLRFVSAYPTIKNIESTAALAGAAVYSVVHQRDHSARWYLAQKIR